MNWLRWPNVTSSQPTSRGAQLPDVLLARAGEAGLPALAAAVQRAPLVQRHRLGSAHRRRHRGVVELKQRLLVRSQARPGLEQIGAFDFERPAPARYSSLEVKRSNAARRATSRPRPPRGVSRNTRRAACEPAHATTCSSRSAATQCLHRRRACRWTTSHDQAAGARPRHGQAHQTCHPVRPPSRAGRRAMCQARPTPGSRTARARSRARRAASCGR